MEQTLTPVAEPQDESQELFDYQKVQIRLNQLISDFNTDCEDYSRRMLERYIDLDVDKLREAGDIQKDETFIPDRLIDSNIMRDMPDVIGYLIGEGHLGDFKCVSNPKMVTTSLAKEFSEKLTYTGWLKEWQRTIDGGELHGRDYIEVVFDPTKPAHVGFEHVGYDNLYYNRKVGDIQDSEIVIRKYEMSLMKFRSFPKFDKEQVRLVTDNYRDSKRDTVIKVYKAYIKHNNCVYVSWFCKESGVQNWLAQPEKLFVGILQEIEVPSDVDPFSGIALATALQVVPAETDMYPIFTFIYREDCSEFIVDKKGRGFLDAPLQEATTAIKTSYVNGTNRASQIYGAPKTDDGESADIKQLDVQLGNGTLLNKPFEFFSTPYPDEGTLRGLQFLKTENAVETGKTSFATNNRKDSRKTAKEMEVAQLQESKITSTNLATFSEFVRSVLQFAWRIVQSQALHDRIAFMQIEQQQPMISGMPQAGVMGSVKVNDKNILALEYDVRPSGEAALEREKESQKIMQDWPVFQAVPGLAQAVLVRFIELRYPEQAHTYIQAMLSGDSGRNLVAALSTMLQAALQPEELNALPPDKQQELVMLGQQVQAYLGNGAGGQQNANQQQQAA